MLIKNPEQDLKIRRLPRFYQAIALYRKQIQIASRNVMANEKGQGRKKGCGQKSPDQCFGIPKGNEDRDAMKRVSSKAAAPMFRPGNVVEGRYVDPGDYERWEKQREERKRKNNRVDPRR